MDAGDQDGPKLPLSSDNLQQGKGRTRRRFLGAIATAAGTFFLAKTGAIARAVGLSAGKGAGAKLAAIDWDALRRSVKGPVVTSTAPDFAAVRSAMVWNEIKPDRSPDVIVTVTDDDDVVQAINFARDNGLKVVVHGGGHTWCGLAVRNGGMTIDLSRLTESKIDKDAAKAVIQPIISNREAARRLGEHGLAFPLGHCPTVKSSGYLLNGGMSWNMGHWGPACFSVEAIEFVTAAGKKVTASAADHPDLFWAARGCGPGMFAVATRYHLKCYPLPKAMRSSVYFYSLDDLKDAARDAIDIGWHKMPETVELSIFMIKAPPELADKCQKQNGMACMITAVAFTETKEQGEAALAPLENAPSVAKCLSKTVNQETDFAKQFDAAGASWPENHRNLCENQGSNADPVEVLLALRDKFIQAPSPKSLVVFCQATGGHDLVRTTKDVALSLNARFYGGLWTIWEKAQDDAANKTWHDDMAALLLPYTSLHYVGETDIAKDHWRARKSFTPEKWQRLQRIRAKYDPAGLFFGFTGGL
jgi:FAD/FMN-containing dehydrogenase